MDVGVLYEPLDDRNSFDKLNFIVQLSFQLDSMIGYYGVIKYMATDIRRTNMWLNESYDGFYTFLTWHYRVKFVSLDPKVNLSKLAVAMEYGLSCFVGKINCQRKFLDVAKTTEIAEWGRGTTAPYCKIYYRWKETYDAFYKLLMGHI